MGDGAGCKILAKELENILAPHLADEARVGALLAHALAAGDRDGVVLALLGRQALEEGVRGLLLGAGTCQWAGVATRWKGGELSGGVLVHVSSLGRMEERGGGDDGRDKGGEETYSAVGLLPHGTGGARGRGGRVGPTGAKLASGGHVVGHDEGCV